MNVLLDTHIILWALLDDPAFPVKAKELIEDDKTNIFYSIISLWEIEIKHVSHPEQLKLSGKEVDEYCKGSGFFMLPLKLTSINLLSTLNRPDNTPPHKDPFDKMLICQSLSENMSFVTHDRLIGDYNLPNIIIV